jgi:hypothetical protein
MSAGPEDWVHLTAVFLVLWDWAWELVVFRKHKFPAVLCIQGSLGLCLLVTGNVYACLLVVMLVSFVLCLDDFTSSLVAWV